MSDNINQVFNSIKKSFIQRETDNTKIEKPPTAENKEYKFTEDTPGYVSFPVDMLVDVSKKLLDLNRGVTEPDHRDALYFRKAYTVPDLLKERIQLDSNSALRNMVRKSTYRKQLTNVSQNVFQDYIDGLLIGNPLSLPLEEINPMHILEQSRRFTQLGPGGIASPDLITEESQNVNPSEFFFIDTIAGPESSPGDVQVLTDHGWFKWSDVNDNIHKLACRINGRLEFHKPLKLCIHNFSGKLRCIKNKNILMRVTPNHRVVYDDDTIEFAETIFGKEIKIPRHHLPLSGSAEKVFVSDPYKQKLFAVLIAFYLTFKFSRSYDSITIKINSTNYPESSSFDLTNALDFVSNTLLNFDIPFYTEVDDSGNTLFHISVLIPVVQHIVNITDRGSCVPSELINYPLEVRDMFLTSLSVLNNTNILNLVKGNKYPGLELIHISCGSPGDTKYTYCKKTDWYFEDYNDLVYSAKVPGGLVYLKGSNDTKPYWSGNSEKIGVDTRAAWGSKLGSDGRLYQKFYDRRQKKYVWLNPYQVADKNIKFPD